MCLERSILTIKIWDTFTQSKAQAEPGRRNAVEGSRARTAGTLIGSAFAFAGTEQWSNSVCVSSEHPLTPLHSSCSCSPALLWSAIRAAGQGDIVPSWRGTVSACEPAHFIHCTSTFPTGIISIKPSALPCSPGLHPLGCLRYCSICEPAQADATSLSQSAKKTNGDSDRTDAPGGFDALLSQATRSTCASASSERHTAPLEDLSHFLATMGRHCVPDCQKRRAENRVEVSASLAALVQNRSFVCQGMNIVWIRLWRAADPQDLISYLSQYLLSRNRDYHITLPHDLDRKTRKCYDERSET